MIALEDKENAPNQNQNPFKQADVLPAISEEEIQETWASQPPSEHRQAAVITIVESEDGDVSPLCPGKENKMMEPDREH